MQRVERPSLAATRVAAEWLQLSLGVGFSFLAVGILAVAALLGSGPENPALWEWRHQALIWLEVYLQSAYPYLLLAGWLLLGALAVAVLALVSTTPIRLRAHSRREL